MIMIMRMRQVVCVWLVLSLIEGARGYGTGAPDGTCVSMTPGHGTEQTSMSDFSMNVTSGLTGGKYTPGTNVVVSVDGFGVEFQGILLQARQAGETTPYGTWVSPPANTKLMECSNADDSITHSATTGKPSPTSFTWVPPAGCDAGNIEFTATIAMNQMTWWKNIKSSAMMGTYPAGTTTCSSAYVFTPVSYLMKASLLAVFCYYIHF